MSRGRERNRSDMTMTAVQVRAQTDAVEPLPDPEVPVLRITGNSPDSITESPHLEHPGGPLEVQQWEWDSPDADGVQALSRRSPGPCSHGETTWRSTHYVSGGGRSRPSPAISAATRRRP